MEDIKQSDLEKLTRKELSKHLKSFLDGMPVVKRGRWIRKNIPELVKSLRSVKNPEELLKAAEKFISDSGAGYYATFNDYYDYSNVPEDYDNFEEWTEKFTVLMVNTMEASQSGGQLICECFGKLFSLLSRARETIDIVGNCGDPVDYIEIDFSKAVSCYASSLIKTGYEIEKVIDMLLPVAKEFRYRKGYNGLADALEGGQRKILSEKLWKIAESEWKKSNGRTAPDEVEGLIAVAEKDNNNKKILEIKKKFAMANARYFDELLHYYDKKKDWVSLSGWAKKGLSKSQRSEYLAYFTKAAEKLNDKPAVLDAKIKYFSSNPTAKMLEDIHEYTLNLGKEWETVFEKLFKSAESKEKSYWNNRNLKVKLLLSEGREKEVYMVICEGGKGFDVETVKMLAKFSVARLSSGKELSAFNELKTLDKRCRKEKSDLYEWIRMGLKKEPGVEDSEYAHVAVNMYRILIDFHLTAAKASRAKYAAYYCAVVKELSELTKKPELWRELADYMRVEYKRKRLIWRFLRDRGMLL